MATDFERLRAMKDEDIDCSDIPELTEEELNSPNWLSCTPENEIMYLAINRRVAEHFRQTGKGYLNRMSDLINSFLSDYVNKQQASTAWNIGGNFIQ